MKKFLFSLLVLFGLMPVSWADYTFLVFGGDRGWIGSKIVALIRELGHIAICAQSRLENRQHIIDELARIKPDFVINAAGIIGNPNVDWCESHKQDTIRTNVIGTLNLADITYMHNLHLTNISTGCIYEYDDKHPMHTGIGFTEEDKPNFDGSFYSYTKIHMESLLLEYPNVLNLRVKMPVSIELDKGFVGKIAKYKKLINVPNSISVLDDLLPLAVDMTIKGVKGNYNFVNPGTITHNQVMELYKKYIDPNHTFENFSIEEQDKILKARRANAYLDSSKLLKLYPNVPLVQDSLEKLLKNLKEDR